MSARVCGKVVHVHKDKRYGFIKPDEGEKDAIFFFHEVKRIYRDLLYPGVRVEFEIKVRPWGLKAQGVVP